MGVDRSITSRAGQVLVLSIRDVEVSLRVPVLLGKTKIDHVDLVAPLADAHEEVVRLNITVDEGLGVNVLDAGNELVGEQQDRLEREFTVAEVEEILETGAEEIKDHGIVVALSSKPADEGDTDAAGEGLVHAGLVLELGMLRFGALELDGDLLTGDNISAQVDVAERARADLSTDTVLVTDAEVLSRVSKLHYGNGPNTQGSTSPTQRRFSYENSLPGPTKARGNECSP